MLVLINIFLLLLYNFSWAGSTCHKWFDRSGIKVTDKNCVDNCLTLMTDMGTYTCPDQCEIFCKPKKCERDPYWKSKIKDGKIKNWDIKSEKNVNWTNTERETILDALDRLPDILKSVPIDGIYRMEKSVFPANPGSTNPLSQDIVLYNSAFDKSFFDPARIITHEIAHLMYQNFPKKERTDYETTMKWNLDQSSSRPGNFINFRAKENVDEDFANNFDYFLYDSQNLKNQVPAAYDWLQKKFGKNFKLKEACHDAGSNKN